MADGNKLNAPMLGDDKSNKLNSPSLGDLGGKLGDHPRPVQAQTVAPAKPVPAIEEAGEDVVYLPGPGDPATTKWRGVEFRANIPKRIVDAHHIEAARTNRFFRVGKGDPDARNPNDGPTTAMEYRAHVVAWLKTCENVEDVVRHWSDDRVLRQACEVGADDVKWLGTMAESVLRDLRMKQGMNDIDVARVWVKYGVLDQPWRG